MCQGTGAAAESAVSGMAPPTSQVQTSPTPVSSHKPDSRRGSNAADTLRTLQLFVQAFAVKDEAGWLPVISKAKQVKGGTKEAVDCFQLLAPLQQILTEKGALSFGHVCCARARPSLRLLSLARTHVIKNAILQSACSSRHLRVQTMAGRQDEKVRANATAGCIYLALRKMLKEVAADTASLSWSERRVKSLSNDLKLSEDFRDAISPLPDEHVILGVKGVSLKMEAVQNLQSCADSNAWMWNELLSKGKLMDFTACVKITEDDTDLDFGTQSSFSSSSASSSSSPYDAAADFKVIVIKLVGKIQVKMDVPGHNLNSLMQKREGSGNLILDVKKVNGGKIEIIVPPFIPDACASMQGRDSDPGPGPLTDEHKVFDNEVAQKILNQPPEQRAFLLQMFLDQTAVRSPVALASAGEKVASHDKYFSSRPHDGSATIIVDLDGHDVAQDSEGRIKFTPVVKDGVLLLEMKLATPNS